MLDDLTPLREGAGSIVSDYAHVFTPRIATRTEQVTWTAALPHRRKSAGGSDPLLLPEGRAKGSGQNWKFSMPMEK